MCCKFCDVVWNVQRCICKLDDGTRCEETCIEMSYWPETFFRHKKILYQIPSCGVVYMRMTETTMTKTIIPLRASHAPSQEVFTTVALARHTSVHSRIDSYWITFHASDNTYRSSPNHLREEFPEVPSLHAIYFLLAPPPQRRKSVLLPIITESPATGSDWCISEFISILLYPIVSYCSPVARRGKSKGRI